MKHRLLLLLLFVFTASVAGWAQKSVAPSYTIKGVLLDSLTQEGLRQTKRTSVYLSVFVLRHLTTGILHDAEHRAACGVNPGSQASVTIIRSLALNEIGTRDALSLIIFCLLSVSILA